MQKINREILALAIPSIITNITTPLLALMDVVIVGHMGSPVYIAAIAVGGTMFNMLYWLFAFLRMGSSGLTAQAHGATDDNGARLV
ncbi:MAG: MATE family efflux transporter, partial [Duncaniella sp.]|nr:MATE family efflux transporter [Duncaniella sp.]